MPEAVAGRADEFAGPHLFEQTDYPLFVRSKDDASVTIEHRDPGLLRDVQSSDAGRILHGVVNFGAQVGRSEFAVRAGGEPEFDFEVEVFPTKLDYASDYERLVAEIQEVLSSLVLDYLRSTFRLSLPSQVEQPSYIEWLTLLRHVTNDLERALRRIDRHPQWGLTREPQAVRVEQVKRSDAAVRRALLRGPGTRSPVELAGLSVRGQLEERRARPTLDTPEHRWLAAQLMGIRRRLAWLRLQERVRQPGPRRDQVLAELRLLEQRINRLERIAPLAEAVGPPPTGFASLKLLYTPGYQEAYRACLLLSLGLHLSGGPVGLSLKDLNLLYEYWCFLSVVRLVAQETRQDVPVRQLIAAEQRGLRVLLQKGREQRVAFDSHADRRVAVVYNPLFRGDPLLVAQQPDMVLTLSDRSWPVARLVMDAKYRVDASPEYAARYLSPGPPEDALNVLHRYRDAILDLEPTPEVGRSPKHTVVQAAALFPYRERQSGEFRASRLWRALEAVGIGAVPALPGDTDYLADWLRSTLRQGGWALADRAIPHRLHERAWDWRRAASEPALIGVLRDGYEVEHLDWIRRNRLYYTPRTSQPRQYGAKTVAIYMPTELRVPGAVTHIAGVAAVDVVPRREIATPWAPRRGPEELQVLYRLHDLEELEQPIENRRPDGTGSRLSTPRWTSNLGLGRAKVLEEMFLETEPEWRLYEDLTAAGIQFRLVPGRPGRLDPDVPEGRAWFVVDDARVQYRGLRGFVLRRHGRESSCARASAVLEALKPVVAR